MAEIKHRVGIKGSSEQIYALLTTDKGLARWWTSDTRRTRRPPGWVPKLFFNWNSRIIKLFFYLITMTGKIRMAFWRIGVPGGACS